MTKSGIYKITNLVNGKIYIGSAVKLLKRFHDHKILLLLNKHSNSHLQAAFNLYGVDAFEFESIEYCEKEKLIEREQYWIDTLKVCDKNIGYNINIKANSRLGTKWNKPRIFTEETRKKISLATKGRKLTENQSIAVREANLRRVGVKYNKPNKKWNCANGRKCKCQSCMKRKSEERQFYKLRQKKILQNIVMIGC